MAKIRLRPFLPKGLLSSSQSKQLVTWYEGKNRTVTKQDIAKIIDMNRKTLRKMFIDNPERPFDNFKMKHLNKFIKLYNEDIQRYKELKQQEVQETQISKELVQKLIDKVEG